MKKLLITSLLLFPLTSYANVFGIFDLLVTTCENVPLGDDFVKADYANVQFEVNSIKKIDDHYVADIVLKSIILDGKESKMITKTKLKLRRLEPNFISSMCIEIDGVKSGYQYSVMLIGTPEQITEFNIKRSE